MARNAGGMPPISLMRKLQDQPRDKRPHLEEDEAEEQGARASVEAVNSASEPDFAVAAPITERLATEGAREDEARRQQETAELARRAREAEQRLSEQRAREDEAGRQREAARAEHAALDDARQAASQYSRDDEIRWRAAPAERSDPAAAEGEAAVSRPVSATALATTALNLLRVPPPPSKSLKNRVGTRGAPYKRRDGKLTVKLQAAISVETDQLLQRHAEKLPSHIKYNDFVDMIVRDGIVKFEADLQESAFADLQSGK